VRLTEKGKPPELTGCNDLHNCTASTASTKRNQIEPIAYNTEPAELISKVAKQIAKQRGTMIKTQNNHYLHATYKTWLLGYTDDLELLLDDASGILHIRSASRIGQSDLGANRKRIEALRTLLQGKI